MSRIFKAPQVNVIEPKEVTLSERELREIALKRKETENMDRSNAVKTNNPEQTAKNIIEMANIEYNETIERMNEQAEKIISDAKIEAELIRSSSIREGYQDGYKDGFEAGKRETEDLANQALLIKTELEEESENLIKVFEKEIPKIVYQSIKKIFNKEIKNCDDIIIDIVIQAFKGSNATVNAVKVSDDDYNFLIENKDLVLSESKEVSDFEVKKDLSLDKGDCVIETACGEIDATIDTQLQKLEEIIVGVIENEE